MIFEISSHHGFVFNIYLYKKWFGRGGDLVSAPSGSLFSTRKRNRSHFRVQILNSLVGRLTWEIREKPAKIQRILVGRRSFIPTPAMWEDFQ